MLRQIRPVEVASFVEREQLDSPPVSTFILMDLPTEQISQLLRFVCFASNVGQQQQQLLASGLFAADEKPI